MKPKITAQLREKFDETFCDTEFGISEIEEWVDSAKKNRVAIIRLIDYGDDAVMITERNLGTEENLEKTADLIANDEHDGLYQAVRKVFKP